jgi:putative aminopeptidase FrvX
MHSPVEVVDLADVEATIELIAAFATELQPDLDLTR